MVVRESVIALFPRNRAQRALFALAATAIMAMSSPTLSLAGEEAPPGRTAEATPRFQHSQPLRQPVIPCSCRRPGGRTELGGTACIMHEGRWTLARCEMRLNNTSWQVLDRPCDDLS